MKAKIIAWLFKYIPILAKKLWPKLKDSLLGDKTPNIVAFRDEPKANSVILFIHGFSGEAENTFGNIPKYLTEAEKMKGWNMFAVGYSSDAMPSLGIGIWAAIPEINKVAEFLMTTIRNQFNRYSKIAIVAHSMGGLVTQQAILGLETKYRNKITDVLLYGTPSNGLIKASLAKFWNRQLRDMSHGSEFITTLRKKWNEVFPANYPFTFKVVAGTNDEFVPVVSSQEPFDKKYCEVVSGNHLAIVKPENKNHAGYQVLLSTLTDVPFINTYADKEAVNLLLGNYNAVVNDLYGGRAELDKPGTVKLVFALEGLKRNDDVKTVLENYIKRDTENNTDILGILAGRYKRAYLDGNKAADANQAFIYYKQALETATQKNNNPQIFYHAINLAFLSLVAKEDTAAMDDFATTTLTAAEKSPPEKWQYAAIAEANIYKHQLDKAKEFYSKAAAVADLREKDSMFSNAYMAYTTLYNTENENDEFIKFLKATLLS